VNLHVLLTEVRERRPLGGGENGAREFFSPYRYMSLQLALAYVNQPKGLVASEGHHYQHSCEQNGWTTGNESKEVCWVEAGELEGDGEG
jgi:hypothetical protein